MEPIGRDQVERPANKTSALTGERCTVIRAREHPLEQLPPSRYQVFTLPNDETNDHGLYASARLLGRQGQSGKLFYVIVVEHTARDSSRVDCSTSCPVDHTSSASITRRARRDFAEAVAEAGLFGGSI